MKRRGHLAEFEVLLFVALAFCGVAALVGAWQLIARGPIAVAVASTPAVSGLAPGVHPDPAGQVQVVVDDPTGSQIVWEAVRITPWFALVAFMLFMLLRVVRSARRDNPFSAANTRRLTVTGWTLLVGSAVAFLLEFVAVTELSGSVTTDSVSASADYPFIWVFSSLGFLAVAEVLKRGRALQSELAGVV